MNTRLAEIHFAGCLLGGAVGDALGAPVELKDMLTGLKRKSGRCMGELVLDYSSER
jgi:ADP-ribosylglycohydrolase